jgi:hypothetical protein
MLSWLFKKRGATSAPAVPPPAHPAAQARSAAGASDQAAAKARQVEDARSDGAARLREAQGDEAALLRVAQTSPVLEVKLAAVEALVTEAALKQAEREFRSHDRRVHRVAKQRLEAAVARREGRAAAQSLVETVRALTAEPLVPVNRVIELDREWQAIEASSIEPAQGDEFNQLRSQLDAVMREQGDQQQRLRRWTVDAQRTLSELQRRLAESATQGSASDIAPQIALAESLRQARPDVPAAAALDAALAALLQTAAAVEARVAWLETQGRPPTERVPGQAVPNLIERWQGLPPVADAALAQALDQRFEHGQRAHPPVRPDAPDAPVAALPKRARASPQHASPEELKRLDTLLQQAEGALAEGRLGDMQRPLHAIDTALETLHGVVLPDDLRTRHQALRAEHGRLKGWQQWGGGRARDDLTAEAEELARLTLAAADPDTPAAPKLQLKAHADAIQVLRARWKELDRLGATASQALWQRFDAALQTAYQPVAAHQAVLKAARQENLRAREALLAALEALPAPTPPEGLPDPAVHWKEQVHALGSFQVAWRQLGPLEHTVPSAARNGLQQRLRSAVDRIEAPLHEARRAAETVREELIAAAAALLPPPGQPAQIQEATQRVRGLQAEWQQQARTLPLARPVENALWARFKAATDAVFAQREAEFAARDAEAAAALATRESLLGRLSALAIDASAAEVQRTLAEVDRSWRQAPEVPRGAAGALDARYREVRAIALQRLAEGSQRHWSAQCDTLAAKLALCDERETAGADADDLAQRWATQGPLPTLWERALADRWSSPPGSGPLPASAVDELLLQLESALDLPATPEWQAARRHLKLRAMKDALEGRAAAQRVPDRPAQWMAAALRQSATSTAQRERLQALVDALRHAPPGSLGIVSA